MTYLGVPTFDWQKGKGQSGSRHVQVSYILPTMEEMRADHTQEASIGTLYVLIRSTKMYNEQQ